MRLTQTELREFILATEEVYHTCSEETRERTEIIIEIMHGYLKILEDNGIGLNEAFDPRNVPLDTNAYHRDH